jgi:hypothetical protein
MTESVQATFLPRWNILLSILLLITGVLMIPGISQELFSLAKLNHWERKWLSIFSFSFIIISIAIFLFRKVIPASVGMIFISLLFLITIEALFRVYILSVSPGSVKPDLINQSNWTYSENMAYTGHPFLHFSGRENVALKGSKALGNLSPFNNFGFVGADFKYFKPPGVVRVACLGESTTADGYPGFLQNLLNETGIPGGGKFEVMNFGHAYWTTNHSLANYFMNIQDFSPDIIVIHHGWNEEKIRNVDMQLFRGDYSKVFRSFSEPEIYDRFLIRISAVYRYFKFKFDQTPDWSTLDGSIKDRVVKNDNNFSNLDELKPFKRNIRNIIRGALEQQSKVIIATIPRTTDETRPYYYAFKSIDQCNEISRDLVREFASDRVILVDLDSLITGKHNDYFIDLAHVDDLGRKIKARYIGATILEDTKFLIERSAISADKGYTNYDRYNYYQNLIEGSDSLKNVMSAIGERLNIPSEAARDTLIEQLTRKYQPDSN